MKKTTINISYDEEKLNAMKLYIKQKGSNFDDEIVKMLDTLFNKAVPLGVRDFISMKSESYATTSKSEKGKSLFSSMGEAHLEVKSNG